MEANKFDQNRIESYFMKIIDMYIVGILGIVSILNVLIFYKILGKITILANDNASEYECFSYFLLLFLILIVLLVWFACVYILIKNAHEANTIWQRLTIIPIQQIHEMTDKTVDELLKVDHTGGIKIFNVEKTLNKNFNIDIEANINFGQENYEDIQPDLKAIQDDAGILTA